MNRSRLISGLVLLLILGVLAALTSRNQQPAAQTTQPSNAYNIRIP